MNGACFAASLSCFVPVKYFNHNDAFESLTKMQIPFLKIFENSNKSPKKHCATVQTLLKHCLTPQNRYNDKRFIMLKIKYNIRRIVSKQTYILETMIHNS